MSISMKLLLKSKIDGLLKITLWWSWNGRIWLKRMHQHIFVVVTT